MASVDDSVPKAPSGPRLRARDGMIVVAVALLLLVLFKGASIRNSGEEMDPGIERTAVLAVGHPAGWIADKLPFAELGDKATGWISPDDDLDAGGGFDRGRRTTREGAVPAVAPESFDPVVLGERPRRPGPLRKLLVTGDSLAQPLDVIIARRLAGQDGLKVERDTHIGTGVSKTALLDWGKLSLKQASEDPDAVVVFIGANEGFSMPQGRGRQVECCGAAWAAEYAFRVRRMMNAYRRAGAARVYYLKLPLPRDSGKRRIVRAVNAAIGVAAVPYLAHVRVLDMERRFTPGGRYRDAIEVDGRRQVVRRSDGIHLNDRGAEMAADMVLAAVRRDFGKP